MPKFRYKARDHTGIAVGGVVEAETQKAVSISLRELGYQVVSVSEFGGLEAALQKLSQRFQRHKPQEVVAFTRQLSLMIRAGLPLIDGIKSTSEQSASPQFRKVLILLVEDLKGGASFSESMAKHPKFFSNFMISMVRAGEAAGILDEVLERLAAIGEEEMELKGRIQAALTYPCLLVVMSLGIVTFLLVAVLPKFVGIFEEAGAQLPVPTVILLATSRFLQTFWFVPPLLIGGAILLLQRYISTAKGRYKVHQILLRLPPVGILFQKTILARFSRIMGALLKSGIQAVAALTITQEVVGNDVVKRAIGHIREAVIGGSNLADPFRVSQVFPSTLVSMIAVGERTGALDDILLHASEYYDAEVERALRTLTSVLEPLLLLVMGALIAFIALSVLLPIFQLVKVFRQ